LPFEVLALTPRLKPWALPLAFCSQKSEGSSLDSEQEPPAENEILDQNLSTILMLLNEGYTFNGSNELWKFDETMKYDVYVYFNNFFGHLLAVRSRLGYTYQDHLIIYQRDLLSGSTDQQDVAISFYSAEGNYQYSCAINHSGTLNSMFGNIDGDCSEDDIAFIENFETDVVFPLLESSGITLQAISQNADYIQLYFDYLVDHISETDKQDVMRIMNQLLERGYYISSEGLILDHAEDAREVAWLYVNELTSKWVSIEFRNMGEYKYEFKIQPPKVTFEIRDKQYQAIHTCVYYWDSSVNTTKYPLCEQEYIEVIQEAQQWLLDSTGLSWAELLGIPYPYVDVYLKYK
jgi:hypothetical protein